MTARPYLLVGLPLNPPITDCAYPLPEPAPHLASQHDGAWRISSGLYRECLDAAHTVLAAPRVAGAVIVLNSAALSVFEAFASPRHLADRPAAHTIDGNTFATVATRLAERGLLVPDRPGSAEAERRPRALSAWIHVTNACNLSCSYCYLTKSAEAMDEVTGRQAIDAVIRSALVHQFVAVALKYAGGEATLNFDLIRSLHRYAQERTTDAGLALQAVVLSNGVALTRPMLTFIHEACLGLMISLDGIGTAHNHGRPFVNGSGSFHQVERAIQRALAEGVAPELSITVSAQNVDQLVPVVHFALDHQLRLNLNFFRANDASLDADLQADESHLIDGVRAALEVIAKRLPRQRLIDGLLDRSVFTDAHDHACGAGDAYLVFDQRGGVAACQMQLTVPLTSVHTPDPLGQIRLHTEGTLRVAASQREGCRVCVWRPWCAGGCPALTLRTTGRTDVCSPYCRVYTSLYPLVVRLEGLRLVRWATAAEPECEPLERFA